MRNTTTLGDILRSYWDSLAPEKRARLDRKRHLLEAFKLVDEPLQRFSAPAALIREGDREVLVLFAANTTALRALQHHAEDLRETILEVLGLRVDEVRTALRPRSQLDRIKKRPGQAEPEGRKD